MVYNFEIVEDHLGIFGGNLKKNVKNMRFNFLKWYKLERFVYGKVCLQIY